MDSSQWPLGVGEGVIQPIETSRNVLERKARPQNDQALNCPRCNSTNTKFCYYNNYSLSQPRYLCKTCRRYWTQGGTLRNVPVGGGSRKNRRPSSSEASSKNIALTPPSFPKKNPNTRTHESQDLDLACHQPIGYQDQSYDCMSKLVQVPFSITEHNNNIQSHSVPSQHFSGMELVKAAGTSNTSTPSAIMQGLDSHAFYSTGFPRQEYKHNLDEYGGGCSNLQETNGNTGRMIFPIEELKEVSSMKYYAQIKGQGESNGAWDGTLSGGSW